MEFWSISLTVFVLFVLFNILFVFSQLWINAKSKLEHNQLEAKMKNIQTSQKLYLSLVVLTLIPLWLLLRVIMLFISLRGENGNVAQSNKVTRSVRLMIVVRRSMSRITLLFSSLRIRLAAMRSAFTRNISFFYRIIIVKFAGLNPHSVSSIYMMAILWKARLSHSTLKEITNALSVALTAQSPMSTLKLKIKKALSDKLES